MANCYFINDLALRRSLAAAGVAILLGLTGCASDGTFSAGDSGSGGGGAGNPGAGNPGGGGIVPIPPIADVLKPINGVIQQTGNSASTLGGAVGALGTQLVAALPGGLNTQLTQGVGGALVKVGDAVDSLGDGLTTGLGQLGKVENPVGVTVGSLEGVVVNTGQAVSKLGAGISLGVPQLGVAGTLVDQVGGGVSNLGTGLGNTLDSDAVKQVTRTVTQVIVPITTGLLHTTQQVGETSGLGQPVRNLLTTVGGVVNQLGVQVVGDDKTPVISPVGQVLANTGTSVAILGGALVSPSGIPVNGSAGLGGLLSPVTGLLGGLGNGNASTNNLLAPVTGLLGGLNSGGSSAGLLAPVTGLVGGLTGGASSSGNVLAPVTGLVAGVTGGLTGGNAATNNVLEPVTNLLGGLTGGPKK
ncbi:collagen-like triple helix repeat-containing protein [Polaromonas sp. SM01]|uniref:collagen-like triple helix repeat-containing protein n=1 Tax=Polaromonas sp. SM01 TaxID=3085630 RepID=UPI002981F51E|nr:collagen-like triple helix repeat-containing protein [Polaromonas sp. SM01]MDW5441680.1 collagen-like triple helix repeat-containing protein [Polaromonas sp. SM01]